MSKKQWHSKGDHFESRFQESEDETSGKFHQESSVGIPVSQGKTAKGVVNKDRKVEKDKKTLTSNS